MSNPETTEQAPRTNFIRRIIDQDLEAGKNGGKVVTRFPPEPNGYLHVGHAKSICLNFEIAEDYHGHCNLRFDDTNPTKESIEFVEAIQNDVKWLGFDWGEEALYSSDYFDNLYKFAVELIGKGLAYVCDQNAEEMRQSRGNLTTPGSDSPFRMRTVEENLDLFERMSKGEFEDGSKVLRAKIDMTSPNMNMRDPTLYRIRHGVIHHQTGTEWCLYPMYDFTHPISDALEGITHSLCTLEFEDHRPLYDWVLDNITITAHPQQIEFSRLNLRYTVVSKRKLAQLVSEGHVNGWDDPRMPTISGLRRRGFTPASIRSFCDSIGISKADNSIDMGILEDAIRNDLNVNAHRRMAVLNPLKVVITNYPEGEVEELSAPNHPQNEEMGRRVLPFGRELYIDRDDFMEIKPNKKFKRLVTDGEVRLRNSYIIRADEVIKDDAGEIIELRCSYDIDTLGKNPADGRKVKGVIHWVSASHAIEAEVRLYDRLFNQPNPDKVEEGQSFLDNINSESLVAIEKCYVEPSLADAEVGRAFQFEREGYFCLDAAPEGKPVWNRTVTLRDSWPKEAG
ncbi:MAG: glutamine--tRNA ligase/YqeY domain fusion protein [Chromatiales bacterium]|nr:glutamine--tRNA ligase/YqeY domain fusion protein [Chromatiales bacterium]